MIKYSKRSFYIVFWGATSARLIVAVVLKHICQYKPNALRSKRFGLVATSTEFKELMTLNLAQRSFKTIDFGTIRKRVYIFLLVVNSNVNPIFHRFRDTAA